MSNHERYVRRIRNADKRHYAEQYRAWLLAGATGMSPDYNGGISAMAAQAVRLALKS